ncbi:alpha/beta hydrolase [Kordiimonas lipolytica]|uniref:Alpha/beta hydrolase n=1 Tax=Kordiimonas lipolytica TaxID=1662421 RepID=A0ABV8UB43_9PROT|nr:alpha/beta hydrolase-fold protein [Kordiimonas lipolytica]
MNKKIVKWLARMVAVTAAVLVAFLALFYRGGTDGQLRSDVLDELRGFSVFLPAGYEDNAVRRYPVVYSLDGEKVRHGALMAANARMLAALTETPEVILVAVHTHGNRTRDYAPNKGAAAFTEYLGVELRAHIDAYFRTSGRNIISGHSYGGLYALYAFAEHPGLFDAHLAFVPSVFHYEPIVDGVKHRLSLQGAPTSLFLVSGMESQQKFWDGFNGVVNQLQARPQQNVEWLVAHYPLPHPLIMLPGQIGGLQSLKSLGDG